MRTPIAISMLASLTLLAGCATDGEDDFVGVDPAELGAPTGKADGASEFSVQSAGNYNVVDIRGSAAVTLFDVLSSAGGLEEVRSGGLDYVYGVYSICVSNGQAAACRLYSREATEHPTEDFAGTIHGPRFDSAASEMFGAIARSQGVAPAGVNTVTAGRYVCGKDAQDVWCGLTNDGAQTDEPSLELAFDGLPALGAGFVYEGWLITPEGPITSGRFDAPAEGETLGFELDAQLLDDSSMFVLTIEPRVGDDPAPSSTHIVAGVFQDGTAALDTVHPAALGTDFTESDGDFFFETPSSPEPDDSTQGVWFLDPATGTASLDLPELPDGWEYEGWVVGNGGPVSTGRFVDPAGPDSDLGGPAAGPGGTPPFPGQDFIDPPMDLVGATIVISVEPEPDDSAAPFFLKPLVGEGEDAGAGVLQSLRNNAADTAITGVAIIQK